MAKIALELQRAVELRTQQGEPGRAASRVVARGQGWTVADVVCTSGPQDRPFEEEHTHYSIAIVLAGSFQYRSRLGQGFMTPGALMLGNRGQCYECGHEHGDGDRCVSFWYAPEYFEALAAEGGRRGGVDFEALRIPPVRPLAPLVAAAGAGVIDPKTVSWEEIAVRLAVDAVALAAGRSQDHPSVRNAEARVSRIVRLIDRSPEGDLTLGSLSWAAGLSPYHFLRTFERLTGVTPHQYVLRARLREAAIRLSAEPGKVLDIALDCGFGDVSNFNRAFRTEFGVSPQAHRRRHR